ncbi:hypothetical protein ACIXGQ_01550 [Bacteroides fragilis]
MKTVRIHVKEKWILLYIERWLTILYLEKDRNRIERTMGITQGSVIGPILPNLFLHYVFDKWMEIYQPESPLSFTPMISSAIAEQRSSLFFFNIY